MSFVLRYGSWRLPLSLDELGIVLTAPLIAIPVFIKAGLYRAVIRYLPERALWTVVQAMTIAAVCWVVFVFLVELAGRGVVPRSVPIIYWSLGIFVIAGSRFTAKQLLSPVADQRQKRPILIYGAGESGRQLASALRQQAKHLVLGFVDDNAKLFGRDVVGLRVYSPEFLPSLIQHYRIKEVILSMPLLSVRRRREIVAVLASQGVKIRTLPSVTDLVAGKYLVGQIKEIDIDDLLGRSSVPSEPELIRSMIEGRTIMVTGAGGSIGSELCRLIVKWRPQRLVLFEANEYALYNIERELSALPDSVVVPVLGSVTNAARVRQAIVQNGVKALFHAAAHKHVPLVETNAIEGVENNVMGTLTVCNIAFENGVENFVLISTDKAVRPTNVMGATKRWAEIIVRQKAFDAIEGGTTQKFCAVRFGNVLGSNGSVVPLFKEQIANGGPLTLTDPDMTRYFMSIHEAAELIVQAGALSEGGDVFLLDMGEPVLIKDLAENMIRLAGLTVRNEKNPDGDIEIIVTGKRLGEKMFEELFYDDANSSTTIHSKILRAKRSEERRPGTLEAITQLLTAIDAQNEQMVRKVLFDFIQRNADGNEP
ncbi:MAG: polysaccharide biosynthesis protein [Candidatus Devosia symbiotica]|nr:polysaccharide biosynthesis protein [Candidatus Devosia symbiotica]